MEEEYTGNNNYEYPDEAALGYAGNSYDPDDFSADIITRNVQITSKLIDPGLREFIQRIIEMYGSDKTNAEKQKLVEKSILMFQSMTQNYSLSYLNIPDKRNTFEYSVFAHNLMETCFSDDDIEQGLFVAALLNGQLLFSRGIGAMQQNAIKTGNSSTQNINYKNTPEAPEKDEFPQLNSLKDQFRGRMK